MINSVVLVGRLTRDPELKRIPSGAAVCSFTLAIDNIVAKGQTKTTSFIPCTAWRNGAEILDKYAKKGSLIGLSGRLSQRSYSRNDGSKASVVEVIVDNITLLESKSNSNFSAKENDLDNVDVSKSDDTSDSNTNSSSNLEELADDDLPF